MARAKSNSGPDTGAPNSRVWLTVPSSSMFVPSGSGFESFPAGSAMPSPRRCSSKAMNVPRALRLRGKPA
jgi:hypothetical protein